MSAFGPMTNRPDLSLTKQMLGVTESEEPLEEREFPLGGHPKSAFGQADRMFKSFGTGKQSPLWLVKQALWDMNMSFAAKAMPTGVDYTATFTEFLQSEASGGPFQAYLGDLTARLQKGMELKMALFNSGESHTARAKFRKAFTTWTNLKKELK